MSEQTIPTPEEIRQARAEYPKMRDRDFAAKLNISEAQLVISRSGASSIADISIIGRPSILIPLATAAGDHQTANARGLVEAGALDKALKAGQPGRIALDVFDTEPLTDPNDPIVNHPSVIATPHIGFVTEDELDLQFSDIYDQIVAYDSGAPIHMINPDVWTGA